MISHQLICPVTGQVLGTVSLPDDATPEQIARATSAVRQPGAQTAAEIAAAAEARRQARLKQGLKVGGITLGCTAEDVALINGLFTLASTAVAAGLKQPTDTFPLYDLAGVPHLLTLPELTVLLLAYGEARLALAAQRGAP